MLQKTRQGNKYVLVMPLTVIFNVLEIISLILSRFSILYIQFLNFSVFSLVRVIDCRSMTAKLTPLIWALLNSKKMVILLLFLFHFFFNISRICIAHQYKNSFAEICFKPQLSVTRKVFINDIFFHFRPQTLNQNNPLFFACIWLVTQENYWKGWCEVRVFMFHLLIWSLLS